jgi:tetratricopeptide (TPR) repeat protein
MGFLEGLFQHNISNPALSAAIEKYGTDQSEDNLVDLWQKFLKAKILLATTQDGAKNFAKVKQMREAMGISFHLVSTEHGDSLLTVYTDSETFKAHVPETTPSVTVTGEQAVQLATAKGMLGLALNPRTPINVDLKVWQYQLFIEKVSDATKLHALATKLSRAGNFADAEGILKGAIFAAQRDPGANHPFTAELNIDMARTLKAQGKMEQAEWTYKRALNIYESSGSMDLEVAVTCEALGTMFCEQDKALQAVPFMQRALDIYEQIPGGKPDSIARILCLLGDIKNNDGKTDESEQLYKRASVTLEERKHPDLLGVLIKMGDLCERAGKNKEALAHFQRAVTVFDNIKRCKEMDMANAAHKASLLQLSEGKPSEALALIERALPVFRREGTATDVQTAEAILAQCRELCVQTAKEQEEVQSTSDPHKPAYGKGSKRLSELPLLDMSAVKSNPKATYVGTARAKEAEPPAKPNDPESQALEQMRAFLDSVNTGTPAAELAAKQDAGKAADAATPAPAPVVDDEAAVESLVKDAIKDHDAEAKRAAAEPPAAAPIAKPEVAPAASAPSSRHDNDDHVEMDELFSNTSPKKALEFDSRNSSEFAKADPAEVKPAVPTIKTPAPRPVSAPAPLPSATPVPAAPPPAAAREVPTADKPAAPTAKAEFDADQPSHSISDKTEIGKNLAGDISSVFNKSVLGDVNKDDRYDKPIGERSHEVKAASDAATAAAAAKAEPQPAAASEAPAAAPVNKLDPSRFDKPIQERLGTGSSTDSDSTSGLFDDLDDSLDSAFNSLLADKAAAEKAAEAATAEAKPVEAKPVEAKPAEAKPADKPPLDTSRFDQPIQARKLDTERFDTPIQERASAPAAAEPAPAAAPTPAPTPVAPAAAVAETTPAPVAKKPLDLTAAKTPDELISIIDERLKDEPENTELWLRKGTALAQLQKMDEAIKVFDKVTTMSPNNIQAWYCKGSSLHLKGNFEDAVYCFNHVLNLDNDNVKSMMRKAECLVKLGRLDQGTVLYDRILVLQPKFILGWLSKGRTLIQQRKLDDALKCYETVLSIEPGNEEATKAKNLIASKLGATTAGLLQQQLVFHINP